MHQLPPSTGGRGLVHCLIYSGILVTLSTSFGRAAGTFDVGKFHDEGDACFQLRHRRLGTCVYLPDCPSVYAEIDRLIFPQVCGFSGRGLVPNICCVSKPPPQTTPRPAEYPMQYPGPIQYPGPMQYPTPDPIPYPTGDPIAYPVQPAPPTASTPIPMEYPEQTPSRPFAYPMANRRPSWSDTTPNTMPLSQEESQQQNLVPDEEPQEPLTTTRRTTTSTTRRTTTPTTTTSTTPRTTTSTTPRTTTSTTPRTTTSTTPRTTTSTTPRTTTSTTPRTTTSTTPRTTTSTTPRTTTSTTPRTTTSTTPRTTTSTTPRTTTSTTTTMRTSEPEEQEGDGSIEFPLPDRSLPSRPWLTTTTTTTTLRPTTQRTTTSTRRPTTTTTTTQRTTTSTRRPTTTTQRTRRPSTKTSTPRAPTTPRVPAVPSAGQGKCFSDVSSSPPSGSQQSTAVISLRDESSGLSSEGDVLIVPDSPGPSIVYPEPGLGTCSTDEGCASWMTDGWRRDRRLAADGYPLAVDEQIRVQLSTVRNGQMFVGLCGDDSAPGCAVIAILGTADPIEAGGSPTARFETRVTDTNDVADPEARVVDQAPSGGSTSLPSGRKYTLVVHRRSEGQLDAWLDGQPDRKTSVSLGPGMALLRAASPAGAITYVQGQEVDGYHMEIGERAVVRLSVTRDGLIDIGLCGDKACSVVRVSGVDMNTMGFSTRITSTNSVTDERGQALQQPMGPGSFPVGQSFAFQVLRRTEWVLDVWLDGDPERKATVPLEPDRLRLKVDSDAGITEFLRGEAADGFTLQPGKTVVLSVEVTDPSGALDVALCGRASCAAVRVTGADGGMLGFATKRTAANTASDEGETVQEAQGPSGFPVGRTLRLVVHHAKQPPQLQAWLQDSDEDVQGGRSRRAAIDLNEDQAEAPRLKTASTVGPVNLEQVLTEGREVAVGETVTVSLTVVREEGWLFLGLCGATSCSAMGIIGASDDARFSFTTRVTTSNSVVGEGSVWQSSTRGPRRFVVGQTLRFSLQRRTDELMDVWLEPAQSKKSTIPLEQDRSVFKVATDAGFLSFDDSGGAGGARPGGGGDSGGYRLAVSEEVRVQLSPARPQGWLFLGLCGPRSCSAMGLGGVSADKLATATRVSSTNSVLAPGPVIEETAGPDMFDVNSTVTLVVRRVSQFLMTVRPEGEPASSRAVVSIPLQPDHDRLDIVSAVGSTTVLPGSAVDGHPMAVDERVRLHFRPSRPDGWLSLGLCDDRACSAVRFTALQPLAYRASTTASNSLADERGQVVRESQVTGAGFVLGRNYTLVVQRQSERAVDVWVDGDPGVKVSLPLEPGRLVFKADSNAGSTYLDARGARDGWSMAVGDMLWVSLNVDYPDGRLYLGLCGDLTCSVVRVTGVDDGQMGFSTALIDINSVSGRGDDLTKQAGPTGFVAGEQHVFVMRHASRNVLEVWLEDDPDNMAAVPLDPGNDRLRITSTSGTTTFVKGRDWVSSDGVSPLLSPSLSPPPLGAKVCVDLEYLATAPDQPITLSGATDRGSTPISSFLPDRVGSWRRRTVLASLPPQLDDADWRLTLSARPGMRVRRVSQCALGQRELAFVATSEPRNRRSPSKRRPQRQQRRQRQAGGPCANGGVRNATESCTCPAGLAGPTCEEGCRPGVFGPRCESQCPSRGCEGAVLCVSGLYCGCAPGFKGDRCDQVCRSGDVECRFPCDVRRG